VSPTTYRIQSVSGPRQWESNFGPMVSYDVLFAGASEQVEVTQKPSTAAPQPGETLEGDVVTDNAGRRKFKKHRPDTGGGGKSYGRSPEEQRAILRQGAQNRSISYVEMLVRIAKVEPSEVNWPYVQRIADAMCADVDEYVKRAG